MKKWTNEEVKTLIKLRDKQVSFESIAEVLRRSERSVSLKYYRSVANPTASVPLLNRDIIVGYLAGLATAAVTYLVSVFAFS